MTITDVGGSVSNTTSYTPLVAKANATVTVTDDGGSYNGSAYTATGSVTGVGSADLGSPTFIYYVNTGTDAAPAWNSLGNAAPVDVGSYKVVASYAGSTNYNSTSAEKTFSIYDIQPTIYTVTNTNDSGTGSLRDAINQADANPNPYGSQIQFDSNVFNTQRTITLLSPLTLSETNGPEVISGLGANLVTVSGNNAVEVFQVNSGVTANLSGLTVSDGSASYGGGIYNVGTLTVTNSTIANNSATYSGGGIYSYGTLTVTNSTIANDSAAVGGGIYNFAGTLTVSNSTFDHDSATWDGGGIENGDDTLTVSNSTFDHDSATYNGGGIDNSGTLTVTNSTIANNSAGWGGGICNLRTLTVINSTIAYNSANYYGYGGGIYNGAR